MTPDEAAVISRITDHAEAAMAVIAQVTNAGRVTFRCHPLTVSSDDRWGAQIARFADTGDAYFALTRTAYGGTLVEAVAAALIADEERVSSEALW